MRRSLPALLVTAACASTPEAAATPDPCDTLEGASFASAEFLPGGLSEPGRPPIPMRWTIEFRDGAFAWIYTDIAESGPYTCKDGVVQASSPAGDREGKLEGDELLWQGKRYVRVAPAEAPGHQHEHE